MVPLQTSVGSMCEGRESVGGCPCSDKEHGCLQPMGDLGANQKQATLLKYTLLPSAGNLLQQTCMATTAWWWCRWEVSDLQSNAWPGGLPSNSSFLLPFLQGPLWEQDHRPPPGCVWRPVHPTAPVRTQPRVFLGGVLGGGQYASGLSHWPSWPLWGWGSLEARSLEDGRAGSAVRGYGVCRGQRGRER